MTAFPRAFRAAILAVAVLSIGPAVAQDAPVALVPLLTLGQGQTQTDRTFYGRAVARQTIDLGFQVAGQIVSFPVVEGQEIDAGSLIAELDQAPFILAVEEARLRERQALREADRSDQLAGTVSAAQREAARTQAALASVAPGMPSWRFAAPGWRRPSTRWSRPVRSPISRPSPPDSPWCACTT